VFKYGLKLFIDALKMSLEIIGGSLNKLSINLEAFGRDGGFATDQEKKRLELLRRAQE
jgi:hypothetical protein